MDDKKLFLLDAYALIYRAYYAMIRAPRVTSKGMNTSAVFGFCNTLEEILKKEEPSHIAVCFDPPHGRTFRHELYPEYKAQRDAQPEDITLSIPYIKRILEAYRIPVIEMENYEADDVIGTLSKKAEAEGYITYMMTPDKDYGQLVTDRVLMYRPSLRGQGFEIRGPKEVCERYGISDTSQVVDLLALEGDASDNVPGCPGVGEKTAAKLIQQWGSVENLLDNTDSLKGALQRKIVDNAEQIRFSKLLVTIKTDVPMDIDIDALRRKDTDIEALKEVFGELEFRTFLARLNARAASETSVAPPPAPKPADGFVGSLFDFDDESGSTPAASVTAESELDITPLLTPAEVAAAVKEISKEGKAGISLFAPGSDAMSAEWSAAAIAVGQGKVYFIPLPPRDSSSRGEVLEMLAPLFSSDSTTFVSPDIKRDMVLLARENISFTSKYFDTSLAHYLLQPEMKNDIEQSARIYLGYIVIDGGLETRLRKKPEKWDEDDIRRRTSETAAIALALEPVLKAEVEKQGQTSLLDDIEFPLARVLAAMEHTGVRIDTEVLRKMSADMTSRLADLEEKVYELAGTKFNISSPTQVGEILFDRLKIEAKAKKTKKGSYSTTEEILEKLRPLHPIVGLILDIRGLRKLLTTYINALPVLINPATGKIHTTFNQTATATGRISSTNPNVQNIPIRTDEGREIRRAFIADPGDIILSADYSQIELRLMADMSADPHMVEAFRSGEDIHRATAAKIYHEPLEEVTDEQRRNAKTANFGIIYGISAFGLAERLTIPRAEAKALIDGYFNAYPGVKDYITRSIEDARANGYVSTVKGRKRYLPDINSRNAVVRGYAERNAVNAPLQGSAADINKIAMVEIHRRMTEAGMRSRMILQVHDELVFNVVPDELDALKTLVVEQMSAAYSGKVPLTVSAGVAVNWLEAH